MSITIENVTVGELLDVANSDKLTAQLDNLLTHFDNPEIMQRIERKRNKMGNTCPSECFSTNARTTENDNTKCGVFKQNLKRDDTGEFLKCKKCLAKKFKTPQLVK